MGILQAVIGAVGGGLADSWLEVVEPENMGTTTAITRGVQVQNPRSSNRKGTSGIISNGSIIHVGERQMMLLVDGGKVIDYSAEPGYYEVYLSSTPSLFNGELGASVKESFNRIKFGGQPSGSQQVYFVNLQELKGIRYGTQTPLQYFDNFYGAELFLRCFGEYSVRITDPVQFYAEMMPRNATQLDLNDVNDVTNQLSGEFLTALQTAIAQLSVEGKQISHVRAESMKLAKYMADALDADWKKDRGLEIASVSVRSIDYDEESRKMINMRNQGAMLRQADIREGFVQGEIAQGLHAAGANQNGAAAAFMGMGVGMNAAGGFMNAASATNAMQMQMQQQQQMQQNQMQQQPAPQPVPQPAPQAASAGGWTCACGTANSGNFCQNCGQKKPAPQPAPAGWKCSCGTMNTGRFCSNCGAQPPANQSWTCAGCGTQCAGGFCTNCGAKKP